MEVGFIFHFLWGRGSFGGKLLLMDQYRFSVCRTGGCLSVWDQKWSFQLSSCPWSWFASGWSSSLPYRQFSVVYKLLRQNLSWTTQWWMWWEKLHWWICRTGIWLVGKYYVFSAVIWKMMKKWCRFPIGNCWRCWWCSQEFEILPYIDSCQWSWGGNGEVVFCKTLTAFQLSYVCWALYGIVLIIGDVHYRVRLWNSKVLSDIPLL